MCGKLDMFMRITLKNGLKHKNSQRKWARYGKDTEETPVRENNQVGCWCGLRTSSSKGPFMLYLWIDCPVSLAVSL
jgi:hypothetical protein